MKIGLSRRDLMKTALAGAAAGAWSALGGRATAAASGAEPEIKVAGYDYDRIRAIVDGEVGLPGSRVRYDFQDIYTANAYAFGAKRTYEVSELGLIPYVTKFIN